MKSTTVQVRFTDQELGMLDQVCSSEDRGKLNRSELIRLLVHREYLRRTTGKSAVELSTISSDFRTGRPKNAKPELASDT